MTRVRTLTLVFVATAGLGVAACGSSSSSSTTTTGAAATTTTSPSTGAIGTISDPSAAGKWGTEPTVTVPTGAPPTQLESKDLIVGTGPTVKSGDTVTVQYVGVSYSSGKVFDASWTDGQPFQFTVNSTTQPVITGWDQGVIGMQVGGRRELIIPPTLAYGASPPSAAIAVNDTLIFIVDVLKIN
jgi:FKBP-type peptidyl-prolyl cis-trans isomerase